MLGFNKAPKDTITTFTDADASLKFAQEFLEDSRGPIGKFIGNRLVAHATQRYAAAEAALPPVQLQPPQAAL